MDIIQIIVILAIGVVISFIATHSWVFICDCFIAIFKKIFHIGKKKTINWHTLDQKMEQVTEEQVVESKKNVTENEKVY